MAAAARKPARPRLTTVDAPVFTLSIRDRSFEVRRENLLPINLADAVARNDVAGLFQAMFSEQQYRDLLDMRLTLDEFDQLQRQLPENGLDPGESPASTDS